MIVLHGDNRGSLVKWIVVAILLDTIVNSRSRKHLLLVVALIYHPSGLLDYRLLGRCLAPTLPVSIF